MIKILHKKIIKFMLLLALMGASNAVAQQSNLSPNQKTNWVAPLFSNIYNAPANPVGHTGSAWSNAGYITDNDLNNYGTLALVSRRNPALAGCGAVDASGSIIIGNASDQYSSGNYVAFVISNPNNFTNVTISTSMNNSSGFATVNNLTTTDLGGGKYEIGGYATGAFKFVQLTTTLNAPPIVCNTTNTQTLNIYNALQVRYGSAPSTANCNITTPLIHPLYNLSSTATAIIDANLSNTHTLVATVLGAASVSVKDNNSTYSPGNYLGFKVASGGLLGGLLDLGVLQNITLTTYYNGSVKETKTAGDLILGSTLLGGATPPYEIGIVLTEPANEIKITLAGVVATLDIYNAVYKCYAESPGFVCNTKTNLTTPSHPVTIDKSSAGLVGLGIGSGGIIGLDNIIDADNSNYASFGTSINLATNAHISIKKALASFPAGYYAGFDISQQGALSLNLLGGAINVETYKNGSLRESTLTTSSLLSLGTSLLTNNSGRRIIGFRTTQDFDEIRLVLDQSLNAALLSQLRIHGVVVQSFCAGTPIACNQPKGMRSPSYPVYVDGKHTGFSGTINAGNSISNSEYAIDSYDSTFASIDLTAALLSNATFAVGDAMNTYPPNTFAAFEIETNNLLNVGVLSAIKIKLIRNGNIINQTYTPQLLAGASVLGGANRQIIGVVAKDSFDGVQLVIESGVANLNLLGNLKIYGVQFSKLCSVALNCNESVVLNSNIHPVIINNDRTGGIGAANVTLLNNNVQNAWNIIDADVNSYATLNTAVGALSATNISVFNPIDSFPIGSAAGFRIEVPAGLLELDLLKSITVVTYNNGIEQERATAGNLLKLNLLGINVIGSSNYNLGFKTTKTYDEIQLIVGSTVSVNLNLANSVKVYGAFVDTRSAVGGGLFCFSTSPDFAVTQVNQKVSGNLGTNDKVPSGTTYGSLVANANNPDTTLPILQANGSYIFTPTAAGKYKFEMTVCLAGQSSGCAVETLTITVSDPNIYTNKPVVNDDVLFAKGSTSTPTPVTIKVLHNDGAGNIGGSLGLPTIATAIDSPSHGSVTVDAGGNIIYSPNAGYFGVDYFRYNVCETPSGLCESAVVKVNILAPDAPNTTIAVNDYISQVQSTAIVTNASTGVLANDFDPEGNNRIVTTQNITLTDTGTFIMNADGSYSFTPAPGFTGAVQFTYQITDDDTPAATAKGTLNILIIAVSDLTPTSFIANATFTVSSLTSRNFIATINDVWGIRTKNAIIPIYVRVSKSTNFDYTFNPSATTLDGMSVNNSNWELISNVGSSMLFKLKSNLDIDSYGSSNIGLGIQVKSTATKGNAFITLTILNTSGGEVNNNNNISISEFIIQ